MKNYPTVRNRHGETRQEPPLAGDARRQIHDPQTAFRNASAFTLIEMLVVIAVIGILAALIFPVVGAVERRQYINHARAEMAQLEAAIERYKAVYGFYPPSNQITTDPLTHRFLISQLYYELTGVTNVAPSGLPLYQSLDNPNLPTLKNTDVQSIFGVGGFVNCSQPAGSEDATLARDFLPDLRSAQIVSGITNHPAKKEPPVTLLVTSVGGPFANYAPLGTHDANPWRYNSLNPTNNPGSYDLWVQLVIEVGQTDLICNWTRQVQINNPLP